MTTQQTVARWEKGTNEIPAFQLKEMAVLFGVSVDSIPGVRTPDEARARSPRDWLGCGKPAEWT